MKSKELLKPVFVLILIMCVSMITGCLVQDTPEPNQSITIIEPDEHNHEDILSEVQALETQVSLLQSKNTALENTLSYNGMKSQTAQPILPDLPFRIAIQDDKVNTYLLNIDGTAEITRGESILPRRAKFELYRNTNTIKITYTTRTLETGMQVTYNDSTYIRVFDDYAAYVYPSGWIIWTGDYEIEEDAVTNWNP